MSWLKIKFGISVVSLMHVGLQWTKFPGCCFSSPENLIDEALIMGYNGVQMFPVHGVTGKEAAVLMFEDAWNAVPSLWHALRHRTGAGGAPSCINDWVVSPPPSGCRKIVSSFRERGITQVVHNFDGVPNHLVEVNPSLDMTPEQIVNECMKTGQRLVLDTEHLYRGYRDDEVSVKPERAHQPSLLGEPRYAAAILSPWVSAIHLKPIGTSVVDFVGLDLTLDQEEKIICDLVLNCPTVDKITMIAEYPPTKAMLLSPPKSRDVAKRMLEAMHQIVDSAT